MLIKQNHEIVDLLNNLFKILENWIFEKSSFNCIEILKLLENCIKKFSNV